jgi:N,N'-diacetylchitobiose transport system permease protein
MSSRPLPHPPAFAAGAALGQSRRRRRRLRDRALRLAVPYSLVTPATLVIAAILGYPIYYLIRLSFQRYGLFQLVRHAGEPIGTANYAHVLHDPLFWHVLLRTVVFTVVNVGLTMLLGTLVALLLVRVGAVVRLLITSGLVLVWSMPVVVACQLWIWMTDYQNGVLNYALTKLHLGDFLQHDWFVNNVEGLGVITSLVVWGAIPFVAITVYAGLSQVPQDLLEAAAIDGAHPLQSFRDVTFPILKPIFLMLTSLSIIWDFGVFTQPFLLRFSRPTPDYYLMSTYLYENSISIHEYGLGSAIAILMLLIMLALSFFYVRQMVRIGEVR